MKIIKIIMYEVVEFFEHVIKGLFRLAENLHVVLILGACFMLGLTIGMIMV